MKGCFSYLFSFDLLEVAELPSPKFKDVRESKRENCHDCANTRKKAESMSRGSSKPSIYYKPVLKSQSSFKKTGFAFYMSVRHAPHQELNNALY